jgi:PAS domain S-box/diguanylate cyclase (GGDEF) domain
VQIFSFLSFLAFIVYLRLGLQVYQADRQQRVNKLFLALTLSLAIWSFGYIFIYSHLDDATAQFWFWNKFSAFGWSIYSGIALHLSLELTRKERFLRNSWAYMLIYSPGVVALAAELAFFGPAYHPLYAKNLFALLHGIYYSICIVASLILVWRWGRKTSLRREKKQARLVVFSGLISFVSGFLIHTIIPLLGIREIPPIGQILALVWAWGVTLAISKYKLLNLSALVSTDQILAEVTDLIFLLNTEKKIIRVNRRTEEVLNFDTFELEGKPFQKLIADCAEPKKNFDDFLHIGEEAKRVEVQLLAKSGESIAINLYVTNVRDNLEDIAGLLLIGQDIRSFKKLEYLSFHDPLTGLYNRLFFEQEMQRLENRTDQSVGIIISDIDGLKLINDTFGHVTGDKLILTGGQVIERVVGSLGIAARVGGDEFAILLSEINEELIQEIYRKIKSEAVTFKEEDIDISLSLSVGYAYSKGAVDIRNLFKEADDNMYREKLFKSNSIRSAIIRTLTETLQARDYITEGHAKRLQDTVYAMGKALKLPESSLGDLRLFAQFHDIGKVGIPDRILFKLGLLTLEEKKEMQRHSEIGYRIAVSSPELLPIADWILKHHEWWDGSGYPIGLKMEEIPLACRILAIADAYDAMTNDRPYRLAMSKEKAVSELLSGAGTQFDPTLVQIFLIVFSQYATVVEVGA